MRVDIRPAIFSDVPSLAKIKLLARNESAAENSARLDSEIQYINEFLEERQSVFVQLVDRVPISFCAIKEGTVRPFVCWANVKDLYVLPEWQSRGFGKKLLMHALRTMRGKGYMHAVLQTAENNMRARRFYEKFGFEKREKTYMDGYVTYTIDF